MSHPLVSVITPTKNRLGLLCEATDSVQKQTFEAWEHIIIDDGSNDGTTEEIARRADADPRIRYVRRASNTCGANVCRNIGIAESKGEFLVFLDSDDLLLPGCLAKRVPIMERNPDLDFATFQTDVFQKSPDDLGRQFNNEILGDDLLRFLLFEIPWIITAPIWRKEALLRLGGFDESLVSWQDVELHIRAIASRLKYLRFADVDHLVRWQTEAGKVSIEQRKSSLHLEAATRVIEKFEHIVRERVGMNWVRQRALCGLYFFVAERWIEREDVRHAFETWKIPRDRGIGSRLLYFSGAVLLFLARFATISSLVPRLIGKWKGWMRLRTNPSLLARSGL